MTSDPLLQISAEFDSECPDTVAVHLEGKLSQAEVKRFRLEIERLISSGYRRIDVDMSRLEYIDSSGLAELVPVYQVVRDHEGVLRLSNPRRLIRHILVSAHLNDLFEIHPPEAPRK